MMTDLIANALSIINNGLKAKLVSVKIPGSKKIEALLSVFKDEGYIHNFHVDNLRVGVNEVDVMLKYSGHGVPAIRSLIKVSKPGLRIYSSIKDLKPYSSGMGLYILSTPKGILSEKSARKLCVGGEVLCRVF